MRQRPKIWFSPIFTERERERERERESRQACEAAKRLGIPLQQDMQIAPSHAANVCNLVLTNKQTGQKSGYVGTIRMKRERE